MKATIRATKVRSPEELRRPFGGGTELAAFEAHLATSGARLRKGAPLALRLSCGVAEGLGRTRGAQGDGSAQAPRPLPEQAADWVESWAGPGSVVLARTEGPNADRAELLVAPVRESRGKPVVSTQKALTELMRQTSELTEYGALQTSWAGWCAAHVDPAIERGARRQASAPDSPSAGTLAAGPAAAPDPPAPATFAAIREAIRDTNLSERAAERLEALLRLKVEIARHRGLGSDYAAPEAALRVYELHPPANRAPDPWPFIEAVRAPALAVLEAARMFGVEQGRDDPEYRAGIEDFPELEDRIRLAAVVARSALFCAEAESRVKNRLYERIGNDPDTCWPHGARKELRRHEVALATHWLRRMRRPSPRKPGSPDGR